MRSTPLDNTKVHSLIYKAHYKIYKNVLLEAEDLSKNKSTLGAKHRAALHLSNETKRPTLKKLINCFDSNDSGLAWELTLKSISEYVGSTVNHLGGTNPYDLDVNMTKVECKVRRTRHYNKTTINNLHPDRFDIMVALIAEDDEKSLEWNVLVLSSQEILQMDFLIDDLSHGADGKQFHLTKDRLESFRMNGNLMNFSQFAEFTQLKFGSQEN